MTDTLTPDLDGSFPPIDSLLGGRWQAFGDRGGFLISGALHESEDHPGFVHIEITAGTQAVGLRRPIRADAAEEMADHMLSEWGFKAADLHWRPVKAWQPRPPALKTESVVYFFAAGPFIKIGKGSGDATSRVAQLQTGCPYPITVMGLMPGGLAEEHALHRRFAHLRAHGEWFHSAPSLTAFIVGLNAGGAK